MHEVISKNIRDRRSIFPKNYSGETVAKEIIEEMLENANWAPTHKFTEPWRFSVFSGEGLKKLALQLATTYKEYAQRMHSFDEVRYNKFLSKAPMASHVISLGMKRNSSIPEFEEVCSVACAAQNMMLTAASHQIGCYWTTGGNEFYDLLLDFLGLTPEDKLLGFLFVGMPSDDMKTPKGFRKSVEAKTTWVQK